MNFIGLLIFLKVCPDSSLLLFIDVACMHAARKNMQMSRKYYILGEETSIIDLYFRQTEGI